MYFVKASFMILKMDNSDTFMPAVNDGEAVFSKHTQKK